MRRQGFTLLEVLMIMGLLLIASGLAVPTYRQYLMQTDLQIARQNVMQGLERARFLAQINYNDSDWGFSTDAIDSRGVVYMGESYALRDPDFDEIYAISPSVDVSGITEVTFSKVKAKPNREGEIILKSLQNEGTEVRIPVKQSGEVPVSDDVFPICIDPYGENPQILQVNQSQWEYFRKRGAIPGECANAPEPNPIDLPVGDVEIIKNGKGIEPTVNYTCSIAVLFAGNNMVTTDNLLTTLRTKENNSWTGPFGGYGYPVTAKLGSILPNIQTCTNSSIPSGKPFHIHAKSWLKKKNWYAGGKNSQWKGYANANTQSNSDRVLVLQDGDPIPSYSPLQSKSTIHATARDFFDHTEGKITLEQGQVLYLFELGSQGVTQSSDFQDLIVVVTFSGA